MIYIIPEAIARPAKPLGRGECEKEISSSSLILLEGYSGLKQ